jgi:5-formyltetrahydrofolate cyclo-ligase
LSEHRAMMDKSGLRAMMRAGRDEFVARNAAIVAPLPPLIDLFRPDLVVAAYIAIGSEADPRELIEAALARGCEIVLPHVTSRNAPMRFLAWRPGDPLQAGVFGLSQPAADAHERAPDIILTALLAFDGVLNRLGQGAGHYDRAFAALPQAFRIGVGWSMQQVESIPVESWDVPLHAVITERDWIVAV